MIRSSPKPKSLREALLYAAIWAAVAGVIVIVAYLADVHCTTWARYCGGVVFGH